MSQDTKLSPNVIVCQRGLMAIHNSISTSIQPYSHEKLIESMRLNPSAWKIKSLSEGTLCYAEYMEESEYKEKAIIECLITIIDYMSGAN